jgi:hypothetical protein
MSEWISWDEASRLTGLPVPTIEHATRVGRIERRPRHGTRPSLDRDSVLAWAEWYAAERAAIEQRRRPKTTSTRVRTYGPPPDSDLWMTAATASDHLSVSESTVRRLVRQGDLVGHQGERLWVSRDSVEAHKAEEARWVTHVEAAELIGCTRHNVALLVDSGELAHRIAPRRRPSIDQEAAVAFRPVWTERQEALQQAIRERYAARRPATAPPDDGDVWVSTATAALALGITPNAVRQRVERGTLPHRRTATRLWFRRRDVEAAAAAQAFRARATQVSRSR